MQPNEDNASNGGSNLNNPKPMKTDNNNGEDSSFVLGKHSVISPISPTAAESSANNNQAQPEVSTTTMSTPQQQADSPAQPSPVALNTQAEQPQADSPAQPLPAAVETLAPQPTAPAIDTGTTQPTPLTMETTPTQAPLTTLAVTEPQPSIPTQPQPVVSQPVMPTQPLGNVQTNTPQPGLIMPEPQVFGSQGPVVSQPETQANPAIDVPVNGATQKKFSATKMIIAVVALIVFVGGGATGFALWQKSLNSPAAVFKDAIVNSLATSYMQEDISSQGNTATVLLNDSNPSQPKSDMQLTLNIFGTNVTMAGYGTSSNGFVEMNMKKTGDAQIDNVLGKWAQVETNGRLAKGANSSTMALVDPYQEILGHWITGNFSVSERTSLANYAVDKNVYEYNASKVTSSTVNGQPVYVYNVTVNQNALKNYNLQVGQALGLSSSKVSNELSNGGIANVKSSLIDIYKNSKQIAKVNTVDPTDGNSTITYTFGSSVQFPSQPSAQITYSQFQSAFGGSLGTPTGNSSSNSASATGN